MTENTGDGRRALNEREKSVLASVVALYLESGEPVASRQVAEQQEEKWSSATIRNTFALLEAEGLLAQPHTSAGRVPTPEALRFYLQDLRVPAALSAEDEAALRRALMDARGGDAERDLMTRACQFLSSMSSWIGLIAVDPLADPELRQIRFLRLTERRVAAILVAADHQVRERVALLPEDYTQEDLDAAARFLNESFSGWHLERIRRELSRRIQEDRAAYDRLLRRVLVLYHCGVLALRDGGQVIVDGASNLVALLHSHDRLAEILKALEAKERLLALVTEICSGGASSQEPALSLGPDAVVRIQVGLGPAMPEFSLVAAPYHTPAHLTGAVAILGPARMEYERAAGAVMRVRRVLSASLEAN